LQSQHRKKNGSNETGRNGSVPETDAERAGALLDPPVEAASVIVDLRLEA
jgi:hypothetical protein